MTETWFRTLGTIIIEFRHKDDLEIVEADGHKRVKTRIGTLKELKDRISEIVKYATQNGATEIDLDRFIPEIDKKLNSKPFDLKGASFIFDNRGKAYGLFYVVGSDSSARVKRKWETKLAEIVGVDYASMNWIGVK